jgi:hypothetical protein
MYVGRLDVPADAAMAKHHAGRPKKKPAGPYTNPLPLTNTGGSHKNASNTEGVTMSDTSRTAVLLTMLVYLRAGTAHAEDASNICGTIPGDMVREALSASSVDTKEFPGRCRYIVTYAKDHQPPTEAIVIYRFAAADFDEFRQVVDEPVQTLSGLGDGAFQHFQAEDRRYSVFVVKRGVATLQLTGESAERLNKLAKLALSRL